MSGQRRAWGWVAHLRAGGSTRWRDWQGAGPAGGRLLPGAQQLELVRRLNLAGRPHPDVVERVLEASAPGRGRPDLELLGAVEPLAFGPPPVQPDELPADELIRVATSVLADALVAAGPPPAPDSGATAFVRLPWRTRYRLVGDPWLADPPREALIARGRPPGGRRATVLVCATDLETMLVHAWTDRCFGEGGPDWGSWLHALSHRDRIAPRVDVVAAARTWAERVGRHRVRIVTDPALLPRLVGVRRPLPRRPLPSADGTELARRLAGVLGLLASPPRRRELMVGTLLPQLVALDGPPLGVPERHRAWVGDLAVRVRDQLAGDGYPVSGDLDTLVPGSDRAPSATPGSTEPSDERVLDLAVRLLLGEQAPGRGQEVAR